jgi:hypothetical protein
VLCDLLGSIAGAHPKNDANDIPRYGDIRVRSAVRTTFGYFKSPLYIPKRRRF